MAKYKTCPICLCLGEVSRCVICNGTGVVEDLSVICSRCDEPKSKHENITDVGWICPAAAFTFKEKEND